MPVLSRFPVITLICMALILGHAVQPAHAQAPRIGSRWTVEDIKDPLTDAVIRTATARVKSARDSATYQLQLRLVDDVDLGGNKQKTIQITYGIYDASPLGLQFSARGRGFGKQLAVRFGDAAAIDANWHQSSEFANVGELEIARALDPAQKVFVDDSVQRFAAIQRRILIQGLRASDEYLEFVIDASFEPFRRALTPVANERAARLKAEVDRRAAQERADADARRVAEAEADRALREAEAEYAKNRAACEAEGLGLSPRPFVPPAIPAAQANGAFGQALQNLQRYVQRNQAAPSEDPAGITIESDRMGVEFGAWLNRFVSQVRRNVLLPLSAGTERGRVVVRFNIRTDGAIAEVSATQRASNQALNLAVVNAVTSSSPTEALPPEYPCGLIRMSMGFQFGIP